jgi:CheY-like chemotaxis protein
MPRGPKPTPITLTDDERAKLTDWARRPTSAQRLALRARIALAAADGHANAAISAELRVTVPTVRKWRDRFSARRLEGLVDEPRPRHRALIILLAEDDDGHAYLVQQNLADAGLANRIVRARDGQEAIDFIHCKGAYIDRCRDSPLLLLLDINTPRVDGVEVLRRLKAGPATDQIPVIVLTTTDDPREVKRCYELGCGSYVTKPVEYEKFVEAIRRLGLFLSIVEVPR